MREKKNAQSYVIVVAGFVAFGFLIAGVYNAALLFASMSSSEAVVIERRSVNNKPQKSDQDNVNNYLAGKETNNEVNETPSDAKLVGDGMADLRKMTALMKFNTENLTIYKEDITSGGPGIDGIPALTEPSRVPVDSMRDLTGDSRVVVVEVDEVIVVYPIQILNHHEIINDVVRGIPIAVTFCPLCDSAMVCNRSIEYTDDDNVPQMKTLEFGVSGLLGNSNILLYDRTDYALWSQLLMEAVSGPYAGTPLRTLPFSMIAWSEAKELYPNAEVVSMETGYKRNYKNNPYSDFLSNTSLMFVPRNMGNQLPAKMPGIGIFDGERAVFVSRTAFDSSADIVITTSEGDVLLSVNDAGFSVKEKPANIRAVQTFYYAWSAYHPDTELITGK